MSLDPNIHAASNEELVAELCIRMNVGQKPDLKPLFHQIHLEKDAERRRALMRREAKNTPWPAPGVSA